jgi:hypothetical protein
MGQMLFTDDISGSINLTGSINLVNGTLVGTSSWAGNVLSSGISGTVTSASYAVSASHAQTSITSDFNSLINKPTLVSNSLQINTGSFTGSFVGALTGTSSWANNSISSSYALSASHAQTAITSDFNALLNKPTLVSNSLQINTGSFTGSFVGTVTGTLTGTSSWANNSISSSYALSASHAQTAITSDFNSLINKPTLVSNSLQINTGSFTGSFTGSLQGSITSASYALSSSHAQTAITSDFNSLLNKPTLVSSSLQVNSGSFTGSFTGSLQGTITSASYALTSSFAVSASWAPGGGGTIDGSGTNGFITRWLDSNTLENSSLTDDGTRLATSGTLVIGDAIASILSVDIPALFVTQSANPSAVTIADFFHNINNYAQINIKNNSSGISASSDLSITSDIGNESSSYINMGINSSGYGIGVWGGLPLDAYILSKANKFYIHNSSGSGVNSKIIFSAGQENADSSSIMIISSSREIYITGAINIVSSSMTSSILNPLEIAHSFLTTQSLGNSAAGLSGSVTASIFLNRGQFVTAVASRSAIIRWEVTDVGGAGFNKADGFILKLTSGGLSTHTWMDNISWPGGAAPTLTPSGGVDILTFVSSGGVSSSRWYGVLSQRNSK